MSDECDKRQEGARPAWQTRTVLLRLGTLRLGVWTVVWCVVGSCFGRYELARGGLA